MIVVADSGPLRYLVLIGHIEILPILYHRVLIPPAVFQELNHPRTPVLVSGWMAVHPSWLEVHPVLSENDLLLPDEVDFGEGEAILLARQVQSEYILMDDRAGRAAARTLNLQVVGTIGILQRAAESGLLDFSAAIDRLQTTNFRFSPQLLRIISKNRREE